MYSENNHRSAVRRADGEFLRRMMGGELSGNGFPVMSINDNSSHRSTPTRDISPRTLCNGTSKNDNSCPTELSAPSLAMVYSPKQCWRKLLDPKEGLKAGTIFAELVLPLEVVPNQGSKEVNSRCCL